MPAFGDRARSKLLLIAQLPHGGWIDLRFAAGIDPARLGGGDALQPALGTAVALDVGGSTSCRVAMVRYGAGVSIQRSITGLDPDSKPANSTTRDKWNYRV
jgi:hypothetical protein